MKDQKEYKLTAAEQVLIAEYQQAQRDIEQQKTGALQLMVRANGLTGTWSLVGDKLIQESK